MRYRVPVMLGVLSLALTMLAPVALAQDSADIPRTPDGRPDLSGSYDIATLTPLQRSAEFGDKLVLTEEEAAAIEAGERAALASIFDADPAVNLEVSDPNRGAPPVGGDGSSGPAGNVGGYNTFWLDRGSAAFQIDGQWRTSIITDPPNGRRPSLTPEARARQGSLAAFFRPNTGTAWWLENDLDASGPYDHPEFRPLSERCLLGFGSTAGPPMLPVLYNNLKRIVQTEDTVMILVEMVHDARVIRLESGARPARDPELAGGLGRPLGGRHAGGRHHELPRHAGARPGVTEPARRGAFSAASTPIRSLYQFTVNDPTVWTTPWSGEYVWPASENTVYEYACHEANYSFGGILRGARVLEADAREAR